MRVLLISDDDTTENSLKLELAESFKIDTTHIGRQGVNLGALQDYDFILLDVNQSDVTGLEMVRLLRASKVAIPFLVLLDRPADPNDVKAVRADECVVKPFQKDDLIARIRAHIFPTDLKGPPVVKVGDLTINRAKRIVMIAGARLYLTAKEYQILELLTTRKGTVTKEMIFSHLYLGYEGPGVKIIDVFVCNLRRKIAALSNGWNYIETVWGRGYIVREPSEDAVQMTA